MPAIISILLLRRFVNNGKREELVHAVGSAVLLHDPNSEGLTPRLRLTKESENLMKRIDDTGRGIVTGKQIGRAHV